MNIFFKALSKHYLFKSKRKPSKYAGFLCLNK